MTLPASLPDRPLPSCDDCGKRGHYCPGAVTADGGKTRLCFACDEGRLCAHDLAAEPVSREIHGEPVLLAPNASMGAEMLLPPGEQPTAANIAFHPQKGEPRPRRPSRKPGRKIHPPGKERRKDDPEKPLRILWQAHVSVGTRRDSFYLRATEELTEAALTAQRLIESSAGSQIAGAFLIRIDRVGRLWN